MTQENTGVRKVTTRSQITLDEIKVGENQKEGTMTAQVRQTLTTVSSYPSKKVDSNLQDNPFAPSEFGFGSKDFTSKEERVAWLLVPKNSTVDSVNKVLEAQNANKACIYKVLSSAPIIDNNQQHGIDTGKRDLAHYANQQAVRVPETEATKLDGTAGSLVLHNSNVQYRRTFFSSTPKEDVDMRDTETPFVSPELKAEMEGASAIAGQTV